MDTIILSCKNLRYHVDAAQRAMNTNFPVVDLDTALHAEPEKMRLKVMEEVGNLPDEVDTVLVAMGFCGGSWKNIKSEKRIVIPRLDDCITLLMTTDNQWHANLKEPGCMYLKDNNNDTLTIPGIRDDLFRKYGEKNGQIVFDRWFEGYHTVSVIDTGVYDSYAPDFLEFAQYNAELIDARTTHVAGSNIILENLVSGKWEEQFLVLEPGEIMTEEDILPSFI